ncbi:MAG TPA: hypothetical protein VFF19_17540, partial [Reyranella sp.]|nr:hypothetical protein [Reyranella sp.]
LGDLLSWLESGIEAAVSIVEDSGVWHFLAKIGDAFYYGVIDCIEKVVGAAMWVYNAVKVAIEDIILFLEFLMAWGDILTTHRVLRNFFAQFAQYATDGLGTTKAGLASVFAALESEIDKFGDIPNLGQTPSGNAAANPPLPGQYSAPSNLGMHHFQGNAGNGSTSYAPPSPVEGIFKDLIALVTNEEDVIVDAFQQVQTQIIDQFSSLSVAEIIKRFLAILADALVETVENVVLTLIDVLMQLADGMMDALTASIDIPVLSWLYKELTGDDLSILDVVCLIVAIPATIGYKATANAAPFPSGDAFTQGLIDAASFAEVMALFFLPAGSAGLEGGDPVLNEDKLKLFAIVTGFASLVGAAVLAVVYALQRALDIIYSGATFLAGLACLGNIAYVSPNIATFVNVATDNWYQQLNNALTGISVAKGFAAIFVAKEIAVDGSTLGKVFAGVETLINAVWNVPVAFNARDNASAFDTTYKSLIPESIGNFAFNLGGMMEYVICIQQDPIRKEALGAAQAVFMLAYGVCMVIAGGIYKWAPDQHHAEEPGADPLPQARPLAVSA